jgi:hypothetical protein
MTTVRDTRQKHIQIRFCVVVAIGAIFGMLWSCGVFDRMPSDADPHVTLIRSNLTRLDTDWSWPRRDVGFSDSRWNEYRTIFRKLRINGLARYRAETDSVAVIVYSSGAALGGSEKGLVYSAQPLTPLSGSLDQFLRDLYNRNRGYALVYEPLCGDWYIYRIED